MKRYEEELNRLSFDQEAKQRMAQHLREAQPRRHRLAPVRRLIAAGTAAALCMTTGAAGAISLANHSAVFREFFNITSAEQETAVGATPLNLTFEDKNGSGTRITVCDVTTDSDCLYVTMELEAPEGTVFPDIDSRSYDYSLSDGTDFYEHNPHRGCGWVFYKDEELKHPLSVPSTGSFHSLPDSDPADNKLPMLFHCSTNGNGFPEEALYIKLENYGALYANNAAADAPEAVLENLDFEITFPLENTTPSYAFEGRLYTLLGDTTPAIIENLSISPYSLNFDAFIADLDACWQAYDAHSPWQAHVTMNDGTTVSGTLLFQFRPTPAAAWSEKAHASYGGILHAHIRLNTAIDPAKIHEIDFGDSSEMQNEPAFSPFYFKNDTYWSEIKEYR